MALTADLLDLERQGWQALSSSSADARSFYANVLDDEPVMVLPQGMMLSGKLEILGAMAGPSWASFRLDDERVVVLAEGCAIVMYRATAERVESGTYVAWMSSIYRLREGAWKLAMHQQTPV